MREAEHIFIDTEFSNFDCALDGLISVAAVSGVGEQWYGVNKDVSPAACSEFVRAHVLPILMEPPPSHIDSLVSVGARLAEWVEALNVPAVLVVDYMGDLLLVEGIFQFCGHRPANLAHQALALQDLVHAHNPTVLYQAEQHIQEFLRQRGWPAHNALADAWANQHLAALAVNRQGAAKQKVSQPKEYHHGNFQ